MNPRLILIAVAGLAVLGTAAAVLMKRRGSQVEEIVVVEEVPVG